MISLLYIYPSSNDLLPIQSVNYCKEAVMKRLCTIAVFAVLILFIISSPCAAETINSDSTTVNPIFQLVPVLTSPTPECQRAIKQLGLFITSWDKGPQRKDHNFCWMLTEDCFYPRKKFPVGLYRNVANACNIGKGSAWKGKTHNLGCSKQLQSLKESVDKLIAAVAVTSHYPPSHPIWVETEEDCRNYGLCEFQLESTRHAVIKSYSKIWATCNMN